MIPNSDLYYCLVLSGKVKDKKIIPLLLPYVTNTNLKIQKVAKDSLAKAGY
jgi:hypothetical protein